MSSNMAYENTTPTSSPEYFTEEDEDVSRESLGVSSIHIFDNENSLSHLTSSNLSTTNGLGGNSTGATNFASLHLGGGFGNLSTSLPSTSEPLTTNFNNIAASIKSGGGHQHGFGHQHRLASHPTILVSGLGGHSGRGSSGGGRKRTFSNSETAPNNQNSNSGTSEKRTATKTCRVCGDKAYSYNFNVITCESCKAFFRRNANKEKEIRCPFNDQCDINIVSRRFCQRCRLQKCFNVGMKKEWIMSEEARLEKKQRIQDNRERRAAERHAEEKSQKIAQHYSVQQQQVAAAVQQAAAVVNATAAAVSAQQPAVTQNPVIHVPADVSAAVAASLLPPVFAAQPTVTTVPSAVTVTQASAPAPAEVVLAAAVAQAAAVQVQQQQQQQQQQIEQHQQAQLQAQAQAQVQQQAQAQQQAAGAPFAPPNIPPLSSESAFPPCNTAGQLETERALAASIQAAATQHQPNRMSPTQLAQANLEQQLHNAVAQQAVQIAHQQQQMVAAAVAAAQSTMASAPMVQSVSVPVPAPQAPPVETTPPAAQDLVAVPADVLMKLIETKMEVDQQNASTANGCPPQKCQCRCTCGRYTNDFLIVDKVMTDLLESSTKYNNTRPVSQLSPAIEQQHQQQQQQQQQQQEQQQQQAIAAVAAMSSLPQAVGMPVQVPVSVTLSQMQVPGVVSTVPVPVPVQVPMGVTSVLSGQHQPSPPNGYTSTFAIPQPICTSAMGAVNGEYYHVMRTSV